MKKTAQLLQSYDAKYDIVKFCLSLLVVAIHTNLYPLVLYPWLRIAVPLFFIMSSYFVFLKLQNADSDKQKTVLKKFVLRNVQLYCFWFLVLLPVTLYKRRESYFSNGIVAGIWNFLRSLFFGSTFGASWYIPATVIGVLLIFLLSKKLKSAAVMSITLLAFFAVSLLSNYNSLLREISVVNHIIEGYELIFGNPITSFPASLVWIFAGKCFAENKIKFPSRRISILIFIFSCGALLLEWNFVKWFRGTFRNDSYFMLLPCCISLFGCIQMIKPITYQYTHYLRHASTVIYVVHGSLAPVIGLVFRSVLHIDSALVTFIITLMCCIFIHVCIEYIRYRFSDKKIAKLLKYAY